MCPTGRATCTRSIESTGAAGVEDEDLRRHRVPGDKARATPVITGNKVIVGTQGNVFARRRPGGKLLAFDKNTGALLWSTTLDSHPAAIITQSATVHGNRVYVGVASQEEAFAALRSRLPVLQLPRQHARPRREHRCDRLEDLHGAAGILRRRGLGQLAGDRHPRGQVYIATGNNYSIPQDALDCVAAAGGDPAAMQACIAPDDHFDSIMALDLKTGAIRWATAALPFDAWTRRLHPVPR